MPDSDNRLQAAQTRLLDGIDDDLRQRAARVRLAVFDVDGTLTDGCLRLGADGRDLKVFHARDGLGLKRLQAHGIEVAFISARISHALSLRAEELGIAHVYQGVDDKRECLRELLQALELSADACAFTGDDLTDLPALRSAGLAVAVANAHPALDGWVHWHTRRDGGHGAARDVCDLLLAAQDKYVQELEHWL